VREICNELVIKYPTAVKLEKGKTEHFIEKKKIWETGSTDPKHESGRPKHAHTEENVTAVDELVLSQETRHKHIAKRQIFTETGLTQPSIVPIIHRDVGLKCFFSVYQNACLLLEISQGIV